MIILASLVQNTYLYRTLIQHNLAICDKLSKLLHLHVSYNSFAFNYCGMLLTMIDCRFGWRRSPSASPPRPRRSPKCVSRHDKPPFQKRCEASSHHSADDDYEASIDYGKEPDYSKSPSPKQQCYDSG